MGEFLEHEKNRQVQFLRESGYFSLNLSTFTENPQRLPIGIAGENLCPAIRLRALDYFETNHIHWPRGNFYSPSPDLCDVTVNCVNYFFPFSNSPTALRNLLSLVYPTIKNMLPFPDGSYVAFLWPEADRSSVRMQPFIFYGKTSASNWFSSTGIIVKRILKIHLPLMKS